MSFRQLTLKKIHYLPYHLHPIPSSVNEQLKIFFLPVPMLCKYRNTQIIFIGVQVGFYNYLCIHFTGELFLKMKHLRNFHPAA